MIKGVVFDLDDTLYLEEDYARSGMTSIGNWIDEQWGISGFGEELHRLWDEGIRTKTFDIALENIGAEFSQTKIMELVSQYRGHIPTISLQPDAEWILNHLQEKFSLGLITDGFQVTQQRKITALGIEKWIPNILITDSLGRDCWKPSPVPYEVMEQSLGLAGHQCVYIGDNVTKDFITAREKGWLTIQIIRPRRIHRSPKNINEKFMADKNICDLRELHGLLPSH
mgnify:CR=1 FL=1|tara:strand:+ start:232 stop:909 length:678 start_codon:yes stop_codon:yes gene_type:complete